MRFDKRGVALNNLGSVEVGATTMGASLTIDDGATVTGGGVFHIDNGASLEFGGSVAAGTVTFGSSSGTLQLDDPADFAGARWLGGIR